MNNELFLPDFNRDRFENSSNENGFTYWYASDLMKQLGYETWHSFQKSINKSMTTCNTLSIPIIENFVHVERTIEGKKVLDFKLSRFGCYLVAMNSDTKKQSVALAQAYFATLAGAVNDYLEEASNVERINVREEITESERSLSGVAKMAGVTEYGLFQNAGYRGLYNKNISQLKVMRGVDVSRSLLDFMGKEELAANLFRITQTELKIKHDGIKGQGKLEATAHSVGKEVRETMIKISNVTPESLPVSEDIKKVKSRLKVTNKTIKKIDKKKK